MSNVILDLAAIKARAEAASKGPFRAKVSLGPEGYVDSWEILAPCPIEGHPNAVRTIAQELDECDALHLAGMDPPTTLALVAEVERLRARVAELEPSPTPASRMEARHG